ncbi:cupin domain-containing protein [Adonisia turfae]|uniref:cupin domain-containing protein n=1 Tax=Adonisia turfae TaxID=2950184 RepID=UPI002029B101|nr:cupin domain-containing protein [Adonisia turfae]
MLLTFWCGSTAASHTRRDLCCSFGTGEFINDPSRHRVEPGEVLFVPAGRKHRFEIFSEDFGKWVFFHGPGGVERPLVE